MTDRLYDVRMRDLDHPGVQFDIRDIWADSEEDAIAHARDYARHITTAPRLAADVIRSNPLTTVQENEEHGTQ